MPFRSSSPATLRAGVLSLATATLLPFSIWSACSPLKSDAGAEETATTAHGQVHGSPIGVGLLEVLGHERAEASLAPLTGRIGALVKLPPEGRAEDYGLEAVAPGIGRLRASADEVAAFAEAHPELWIEMATSVRPTMEVARQTVGATTARAVRGLDGRGVLVGVADTGLDVTHSEMRDAAGNSRVAWMLDLSLPPAGVHPELEARFGIRDKDGALVTGRVLAKSDIDELLRKIDDGTCTDLTEAECAPADEKGHGTHVTGIAAGGGENGSPYGGIAPKADIAFVRIARAPGAELVNDDLLRAVEFLFDRADAEGRPMVINMSLGSDFGPHDGTLLWEQAIAAQVGPTHPGRIIVAAAGNSGSIVSSPIHQSVRVNDDNRMRVPIVTYGGQSETVRDGKVQVWVTLHPGANLKVGLESPEGDWIAPLERGRMRGRGGSRDAGFPNAAGVIYGSQFKDGGLIPKESTSAVVVWEGSWPAGTWYVTLEGTGMAELYVQGLDDAVGAHFADGVREGTVNLPATHPAIIGVGCTVNRAHWLAMGGIPIERSEPTLDVERGRPFERAVTPQPPSSGVERPSVDGDVCYFSGSGPTASGVPKPEIAAPGMGVASALSRNAKPGGPGDNVAYSCDGNPGDFGCRLVDKDHVVLDGTSMSSPVVAGVVALLLQVDPTLTQDKVLALLQAGAHRLRHTGPFDDAAGPGEVDVMGSLAALEEMNNPALHLPARSQSWLTLSADYVAADGSTPLTAIVELRTEDGAHRADLFDSSRLRPVVTIDGRLVSPLPELQRRGPGVWTYSWYPRPGHGGSAATLGATFDGAPIVEPRTIPIGTDRWSAFYSSSVSGSSCAASSSNSGAIAGGTLAVALTILGALRRRAGRARRR